MRSPQPKPITKTTAQFLRAHHGRAVLAAFTGQDHRAWALFLHALELYAGADPEGQNHALRAATHATLAMQPSTRVICRLSIPAILDWSDSLPLWDKIARLADEVRQLPLFPPSFGHAECDGVNVNGGRS